MYAIDIHVSCSIGRMYSLDAILLVHCPFDLLRYRTR